MYEANSCQKEQGINAGLPRLDLSRKPYSWFEFLPVWLVYLPVVIYWLLLSMRYRNFGLPMLANPNIPHGGMVGESKSQILSQAGSYASGFILPWVLHTHSIRDDDKRSAEIAAQLRNAGLNFPLVAKPDVGCRGESVQKCDDLAELLEYLRRYPPGRSVILQKMAPWGAEAGVFYIRQPGAEQGRVVSLTLKYRATVCGDGKRNLRELIEADVRARRLKALYFETNRARLDEVPDAGQEVALGFLGSHCKGSIFQDGACWITPALCSAIDAVMQDFPEFHYGRLDVKFEDIEQLANGKNFCILEVNGVSSEQTHIWDAQARFRNAMRVLFGQYRTLFAMGDQLRKTGLQPPSAWQMLKIWIRELKGSP